MNYGSLQSRVLALIGRAPNPVCYELVTADINREMRLRVMEVEASLTASATVSLPDDFLEVRTVYIDGDPRTTLAPTSLQALNGRYVTNGYPKYYAIADGEMHLNPTPDSTYTIGLRYIGKLADLSADADENDVLTTYPDIYVYGVLAHHAHLIGDERAAIWGPLYEQAKQKATAHDARQTHANGPMHIRSAYATP